MGLIFRNLLLFLALELCFTSTGAQEFTVTDANITSTLPNIVTVEDTTATSSFHLETISSAPVDPVTDVQTDPDTHDLQTTLASIMSTMQEETTTMNTTPLDPVIEQTTPESAPETATTAQIQQTTMTSTTSPVYVETTVTEQKTPEATTTSQYETTVAFNVPKPTSPSESPTEFITTAALAMTTSDSIEDPSPTTNMIEPTPADTSTTTPTETPTSTSQLTESDPIINEVFNDNTVFKESMLVTSGVNVGQSVLHEETNWLLIIIVGAIVACVLCVIVILFIQQRKKKATRTFGPAYMNGQSKRSKKKKGAEEDRWAGPVNLEAGAEGDADVQEGLLHNDEKKEGDDVVLSTFATLDEDAMSNGVGGEGTKEAKKWEEQEPMPFIDEDADENKAGKTVSGNESSKGDGKSAENMNGGETFCLTTAV